ncbi:MAG: hypothetical protein HY811_08095 [Planctomycetes bacterium]|nr:hypothetical protein [Planctomycetota bacterium]
MYEHLSLQERLELISRILLKGIFYLQHKQRLENEKLTKSNQSAVATNGGKDVALTSGNLKKPVN